MPSLQRLYDAKKTISNFKLVTVIYKDTAENAAAYLKSNNFSVPFMLDPDGSAASAFGLTGVPETYIIDKKGVLREKVIGPAEFDSPDALGYFEGLLKE